jgi:putative DNA primase/helicase
MDTFAVAKGDRPSTDLAGFRGARLVLASETEEGRCWDEQRIKAITGGDPITARFMRQDFFTYWPTFKPTVYGNHKPVIRTVDDAMRRRLIYAHFRFVPSVVDKDLPDKLRAEEAGILRWAIVGATNWQKDGLNPPGSVRTSTSDYLADQDSFTRWVDDCCETGLNIGASNAALISSWEHFAASNGEPQHSAAWLRDKIATIPGVSHAKDCSHFRGRGFTGIRVRRDDPPPPQYSNER